MTDTPRKRVQKRPRTVEYATRKRTEPPETSKVPTVNPYTELGACTLTTLYRHTLEWDHGKLDLIRRVLVAHYRRERGLGETRQSYRVWRRERIKEAQGHTMTAMERAIVEAIE